MEDHVFQVGNTEIHPQMVDVTRCSISICLFTTACHARKKIRIKEDTQIPKVQSLIEAIGGRYLIYLPNLKIDMALLLYLALEIWTNMHNCIYQGEYYLPILCPWLSPQRRENLRVLKVVVWPHCNKLMKGDPIPVKQMLKLSMFFGSELDPWGRSNPCCNLRSSGRYSHDHAPNCAWTWNSEHANADVVIVRWFHVHLF